MTSPMSARSMCPPSTQLTLQSLYPIGSMRPFKGQPLATLPSLMQSRAQMLLMDDLEEGALGLVSGVDTGGLLLLSLQFNSQFVLWLVINCWTSSVTSLTYALDPDFVTLQIAVVPDCSIYHSCCVSR